MCIPGVSVERDVLHVHPLPRHLVLSIVTFKKYILLFNEFDSEIKQLSSMLDKIQNFDQ